MLHKSCLPRGTTAEAGTSLSACGGRGIGPPVPRASWSLKVKRRNQSGHWHLQDDTVPQEVAAGSRSLLLGGQALGPEVGVDLQKSQTSRRARHLWLFCKGARSLSTAEIPGSTQVLHPEKIAAGYAHHMNHQEKGSTVLCELFVEKLHCAKHLREDSHQKQIKSKVTFKLF